MCVVYRVTKGSLNHRQHCECLAECPIPSLQADSRELLLITEYTWAGSSNPVRFWFSGGTYHTEVRWSRLQHTAADLLPSLQPFTVSMVHA